MSLKKVVSIGIAGVFFVIAGVSTYVLIITSNLPKLITVEDYSPLLVSEVYDRHKIKIGEFFREKRLIAHTEEIPDLLKKAFIASEDSSFYDHGGVNYVAMVRAFLANIKAGRKVQGASTITQQVARSLLLTSEKTYTRKIKEVVLAYRMEANLNKEDILYLYLNQIYLGHGSYGVKIAAQIYFRKPLAELNVSECAILAGLPQAPSRYTPVYKPKAAKNRQIYVLNRMATEGYITEEEAQIAIDEPVKIYARQDYKEIAPYYLESIRQVLVKELGEEMVLDKGIRIFTGLDKEKQLAARQQVKNGLRELDKRQGYRGAKKNISDTKEIGEFLLKTRNKLIDNMNPERILQADGSFPDKGPLQLNKEDIEGEAGEEYKLPEYIKYDDIFKGIVTHVDDKWGLVRVRFAETKGLIDIDSMKWARKPNPKVRFGVNDIESPSAALSVGDIIEVKLVGKKFYSSRVNKELNELKKEARKKKEEFVSPEDLPDFKKFVELELEQGPIAQGSLVSFDQKTSEIISYVGGYDFAKSKFNRVIQSTRQTGSAFKALVYAAALDRGFNPSTKIQDAPLVFGKSEGDLDKELEDTPKKPEIGEDGEKIEEQKTWKPANYNQKFSGDVLFRNALIKSLNIPTIKVITKIGVPWVADYARRLGIYSPLNMDYTLALGSSGVTLYEMTKVFSEIGRLGKKTNPILIHRVLNKNDEEIMQVYFLDQWFQDQIKPLSETYDLKRKLFLEYEKQLNTLDKKDSPDLTKESLAQKFLNETSEPYLLDALNQFNFKKSPPLYFKNKNQLMKPSTAYIITSLLRGVIEEGTGRRARALGRPAAGKTGTTNGYFDAWFVGFTPDIVSGVWVGYDVEKPIGNGEGGGKAALPIWLEYMKEAHKNISVKDFTVPEDIVFANIDNESGKLASPQSKTVVRQAFLEGTEPTGDPDGTTVDDSDDTFTDFYKQELDE